MRKEKRGNRLFFVGVKSREQRHGSDAETKK